MRTTTRFLICVKCGRGLRWRGTANSWRLCSAAAVRRLRQQEQQLITAVQRDVVAAQTVEPILRDLHWPPLGNLILCLQENLERILPDHAITRRLVNLLRAGTLSYQAQ